MKAPEMTIDFDTAGTGHCLYSEAVDLQAIGHLSMRRASQIEFNPDTQHWEVLPPDGGTPMFCHPSRSRCLAWEHEHLQHRSQGSAPNPAGASRLPGPLIQC